MRAELLEDAGAAVAGTEFFRSREFMAAAGEYTEQAITGAAASRSSRPVMVRPVLVHPTGFRMSPYADIKPAGEDTKLAARRAAAPRKLWHSSPGSSGH